MCICLANIYLGRKRRILAHPTIILNGTKGRNCSYDLESWQFHFWLKAGKMLGLASSVLVKRRSRLSSLPLIEHRCLETIPEDVRENEIHLDTAWLGQFLRHTSPQFLPEKASGLTAQRYSISWDSLQTTQAHWFFFPSFFFFCLRVL